MVFDGFAVGDAPLGFFNTENKLCEGACFSSCVLGKAVKSMLTGIARNSLHSRRSASFDAGIRYQRWHPGRQIHWCTFRAQS